MGNLLKRQQGYGKLQPDEQQQQQQKQQQQQQQDKSIEMEAGKNLEQDSETAAAVMNDDGLATLPEVVRELRELGGIAVPITAMNCVVYVRAMVSVLCLGRLGGLELAGGALSIGFTNITGYSVLFGLASGMDPICSQAFGSCNWQLIDLSLQRTVLFLAASCIPIAALWINMERILLALGQDAGITAVAQSYCLWSLPDLLANAVLQPLRVFFRCQGLAAPMMWCSAVAVALHIPLNIVLVFVLRLGVPGVAVAAVWTNFNMIILLLGYIRFSGAVSATWSGCWRLREAARDWGPLLSLALPSCCAICLEWWWYEIVTLLAGYLPEPRVAVATTAVLIQTTSLMYTLPLALSSSVSVRVGFELGAGRPAGARRAAVVALGVAAAAGGGAAVAATVARHAWGRLFTSDAGVLALTAAAMPIVGLCELGNCPQTTGCGVLRGSARPSVGARINLASFYLVGTPVAVALAFWFKLGFEGLWFGLLAAQAVAATSILWAVFRTDWQLEAVRAASLTKSGQQQQQQLEEVEIVEPGLGSRPQEEREMNFPARKYENDNHS